MWKKVRIYAISAAVALAVGGISSFITMDGMEKYKYLRQPPLSPPDWVFIGAWVVLYILMGIGAARVYIIGDPSAGKSLVLYGLQLMVNFFWPILFFLLEARLFAFLWLLILLGLVIWMKIYFGRADKIAGQLQTPYIAWLLFAGYLNLGAYLLNG